MSSVEKYIPYEKIIPSKLNDFPVNDIEELTESLRLFGLLQPLVVKPDGDGTYLLLGGERRYTAIGYGKQLGYANWFEDGVRCEIYETDKFSDIDEKIIIYEQNIHNRNLQETYLEKVRTLCDLYKLKFEDAPTFTAKKLIEIMSKKLGVGSRQTQKVVFVATSAASWIVQAVDEKKMTIDTASIISHLDDNAQKELKEYFDANGSVPEDVLNKYRKKKQNTIGIPGEEKTNEIPDRDRLEAMDSEPRTQGQWSTKETPLGLQEDHADQKTSPEEIPDCSKSEKYPNTNTEQPESHAQGIQVPANFNPSDYAPSIYNPEEDFEESGFEYENNEEPEDYYPEEEYNADSTETYDKPQKGNGNSGYSNPTASLTDDDEMSALDAISWFSRIEDKGVMTDMERVYINSIVRSLAKFYFPDLRKKGFIPEGMRESINEIAEIINPLLGNAI